MMISSPGTISAAQTVRDEIDRFRAALGEDDLIRRGGVEEAPDRLTRLLVKRCRFRREEMRAAMDIGVSRGIGVVYRVEHDARLLRRGAVVEIDERLAIHLARQDREFRAQRGDIEARWTIDAGRCDASRHD